MTSPAARRPLALLALVALAAVSSASAASPAEEAALAVLRAVQDGDAAAASALFAADSGAHVALPAELPVSGSYASGAAWSAAAVDWYGRALELERLSFAVERADEARRTVVVRVEAEGVVRRSGNDVATAETYYFFFAPGAEPLVSELRVTADEPRELAEAHRVRAESLYLAFSNKFFQKGPGAVASLIAKKAVVSVSNAGAEQWPKKRRGPKGFEKFYDTLARAIQWRAVSTDFVYADATDCIARASMEVNLFSGKREALLPVAIHTSFNDAGKLTQYKIELLEQLTDGEMATPDVPMGMPSHMGGEGGGDEHFQLGDEFARQFGGGAQGPPGAGDGPQGIPGGTIPGSRRPNVHVEL